MKLRLVKVFSNFVKRTGMFAKNNVNVVVDGTTKLNNSLHLFNNGYLDSTALTHINEVLCASVPSVQNGGLPVILASKVFNFTMDTSSLPESA